MKQWIGKQEFIEEIISAEPLHRMRATLDMKPVTISRGDAVPALWHWAYFLIPVRASELGRDGHPALGGFMPPVPLPRRMWAGGQFTFGQPVRVGDRAKKRSTIRDVKTKQGRTGMLCFVEVEHSVSVDDESRFSEIHNIVYREAKLTGEDDVLPPQAPANAEWSEQVVPNSTQLFRYSALTFNGHRIHYDLDFCRQTESYPGLVFHGPLTATLLLELAMQQNSGRSLTSYEFRAFSPLFDNAAFTLNGRMLDGNAEMWAANADGRLAMKSTVRFSS
ncbi:MAG: HTD2 family dehydratase [Planctomycetota bacterium]